MSKLKDIRESKGMSRAELADQSNVKITAIRDYEQGHKPINNANAFTVLKLARALDVKMEDLMERDIEDIRMMLLHDGINDTLVFSMTDKELYEADSYEDYDDYNHYMNFMGMKYNI